MGHRRRSRQAQRRKKLWTTAARVPCCGNLTAPMAPGPSTARLRTVSTTYWRWRQHRGVKPTQEPPVERPAMRPRRTRMGRKQRRRGTKPCSLHSPREAKTEARTRQGTPPERLHALNVFGRKGGEGGGGTPTQKRATTACSRDMGGPLNMEAREPTVQPRPGQRSPPPPAPAALTTRVRAGGGGEQAARTHRAQPEAGGRGVPPSNGRIRPQHTACQ